LSGSWWVGGWGIFALFLRLFIDSFSFSNIIGNFQQKLDF
jgi:hypothetical protein